MSKPAQMCELRIGRVALDAHGFRSPPEVVPAEVAPLPRRSTASTALSTVLLIHIDKLNVASMKPSTIREGLVPVALTVNKAKR